MLIALLVLFTFALSLGNIPYAFGAITIPVKRHLNPAGMRGLVSHDRARAHFLTHGAGNVFQGPPVNASEVWYGIAYFAQIGVGNPSSNHSLIIDTGSSNIWVNTTGKYVVTNTSIKTSHTMYKSYGSYGQISGTEWLDKVLPGPGLSTINQSIGVASWNRGFGDVDGILGIGPIDLTNGTVWPETNTTVPTVTDSLYAENQISTNTVSIGLKPFNSNLTSVMTWGEPDPSQYVGDINYIPKTSVQPASLYWGFDANVGYGGSTLLSNLSGIIDSRINAILLNTTSYKMYQNKTGARHDNQIGMLYILPEQYAQLQNLTFVAHGVSYDLTPDAQVWPRSLNQHFGGSSDYYYLVVNDLNNPPGVGYDLILGYPLLERYYAVFNSRDGSVGLAATNATYAVYNYNG